MKSIKILGFTIFLTVLFVQIFGAYGHLPCQSEEDDVTATERVYNLAQQDVDILQGQIDAKFLSGCQSSGVVESTVISAEIAGLKSQLREAKRKRDTAKQNLDNARRARDRCIENDRRDCPGDCSKLHTQTNTSCECNCRYSSSYGCECGPCSSRLGGG